jgi:hypothetical protein
LKKSIYRCNSCYGAVNCGDIGIERIRLQSVDRAKEAGVNYLIKCHMKERDSIRPMIKAYCNKVKKVRKYIKVFNTETD